MKKSFSIPMTQCEACNGRLVATVATGSPILAIACAECGSPVELDLTAKELGDDLKENAKLAASTLSRALLELRDTVPKSMDDLAEVVRNPRHPFTATLLAGLVIILMEMSGFGIFLVLTWILGNLILNPIGWVLIPAVVAVTFAYRQMFARESFERIRKELDGVQAQFDQGEITEEEFRNARDQVLAKAFESVALEGALRDGEFQPEWIERIRVASVKEEPKWIRDKDHQNALLQAIRNTESQLFVYSGWLGINVIDVIYDELKSAIDRGARIFIGYGWQSPSNPEPASPYETRAIERLAELNDSNASFSNITIKRFPNHSKLLVCDQKYVICGSANWLNNRDYHNRELSIRISEESLVAQLAVESAVDFR